MEEVRNGLELIVLGAILRRSHLVVVVDQLAGTARQPSMAAAELVSPCYVLISRPISGTPQRLVMLIVRCEKSKVEV